MSEVGFDVCPTCGPHNTEQHPRRLDVMRCSNCKEWLLTNGRRLHDVTIEADQ
jgi:DNA-directed RNA polymerase subunit RPC12/RpoP